MGEAKYRKLHDGNYGKPNKMRGLIITNKMEIDEKGTLTVHPHLDDQALRSALFYWDRLSWPSNGTFIYPGNADSDFLQSAGILYRPTAQFIGTAEYGDIVNATQISALTTYENETKGMWSIGQELEKFGSARTVKKDAGTLIQLLNAVPVPSADVPLAEILRFKEKRRDELLHFREHFENLVDKIADAPNHEEELIKTLSEIDQACSNLLSVTREWDYPVKLANTEASFNFDINKAIVAADETLKRLSQTSLGLATQAAAVAGAVVLSQLKFNPSFSFQSIKRPKSPFRYAYLAQRDLQ